MLSLSGRVALVTGTRRIGSAIGVALARDGADVAVTWKSSVEPAEAAAGEIRALGRKSLALQLDLGSQEAVEATVDRVGA